MPLIRVPTLAAALAIPDPKSIFHVYSGGYDVLTGADAVIAPVSPLTQDQQDAYDAANYAKLRALVQMTPTQVSNWVANNVTNLAQAQDAIATLAIAVAILARKLGN